jgi:CRISPR-associated protein Cst2
MPKRKTNEKTYWSNASTSALLHREVTHTAFQYPFALSQRDCLDKPEWTRALLEAVAQLNGVAGGHARAYYEFAPCSVVVRLTPKLVAGYNTYGFNEAGEFPELSRWVKLMMKILTYLGMSFGLAVKSSVLWMGMKRHA